MSEQRDRTGTHQALAAPERPPPVNVDVDTGRMIKYVVSFCLLAEALFVVLDYHVNYGRLTDIGAIRRMANIAREDSLASWFGTTQSLMIALTLWLIYLIVRHQPGPWMRRAGWLILAAAFSYMTVDDGAQLHERFGTAFGRVMASGDDGALGSRLIDRFPSYNWQLLFLPAFAALGLFALYFVWRESRRRSSRILVVVAISCFVFAVGLDFFEGLDEDHRFNIYTAIENRYDLGGFTRARFEKEPYETLVHFSKSIEEFIEMMGNTFLWLVFLRQLSWRGHDLRVRFRSDQPG